MTGAALRAGRGVAVARSADFAELARVRAGARILAGRTWQALGVARIVRIAARRAGDAVDA